jgi:hypothetical protein
VTRTLIVSRDTICSLLEAHASMAAWYYQLSNALRAAGANVDPPDEAFRLAFVQQIGTHFPDLGEVARSIEHPRPYIPPPAFVPPAALAAGAPPFPPAEQELAAGASPQVTQAAATTPALIQTDESTTSPEHPLAPRPISEAPPSTPPQGAVPPPPLVDPKKVRYE